MKIGGDAPFLPLFKADAASHTIWAHAAVEEPDKAREIMDYVSAKPQFQAWSKQFADATLGKSLGNIRAMHNPRHLAGKVQEIGFNDDAKVVTVCIKVLDPVDWLKVEEGGYTGLSIGGGYLKKWKDGDLTRYTPRIAEISLVDSPCIPGARFLELQKADGSIEEVLLKGHPHTFAELLPPPTFADLHKATLFGRLNDFAGKVAEHPASQVAGSAMKAIKTGKDVLSLAGGAAGLASGAYEIRHRKKDRLPPGPRHMQKSSIFPKAIEAGGEALAHATTATRGKTFTTGSDAVKEALRRKWGYTARHNKPISGPVDAGHETTVVSRGKTFTSHSTEPGFRKQASDARLTKSLLATGLGAAGAYAGAKLGARVGARSGMIGSVLRHAAKDPSDEQILQGIATGRRIGRVAGAVAGGAAGLGVGHALVGARKPKADLAKPAYMTKAANAAQREKIALVMREHKQGKLRSWRGINPRTGDPRKGPKVTDRRQAIAIALSQARRMDKVEDSTDAALGTSAADVGAVAATRLSEKQHEQRRTAAKARWLKEGHHDLDTHLDSLKQHAGKAILGRANKLAAVEQQRQNTWDAVADTHAAYDKVRKHLPKHANLMMEVPHAAGLLHNPEGVGDQHFGHDGKPEKPLYILHPAEADDWIKQHGKGATTVGKASPRGLIAHIRQICPAQAAA